MVAPIPGTQLVVGPIVLGPEATFLRHIGPTSLNGHWASCWAFVQVG